MMKMYIVRSAEEWKALNVSKNAHLFDIGSDCIGRTNAIDEVADIDEGLLWANYKYDGKSIWTDAIALVEE